MSEHTIKLNRELAVKMLELVIMVDDTPNGWIEDTLKNWEKDLNIKIIDEDYLAKARGHIKNADKFLVGDITIGESHYQLEKAVIYLKKHIAQQDEKIKRLEGEG